MFGYHFTSGSLSPFVLQYANSDIVRRHIIYNIFIYELAVQNFSYKLVYIFFFDGQFYVNNMSNKETQ